jgi:hypothetical protein
MGKKTGKKTQILLRLDEEPELLRKFEAIKRQKGIHSNVDLVRMLINEKYEELKKDKRIT